MVEALKTNSTQQQRKLRYNNVGVEGARAVADTLRTSSTLQELMLDNNNIWVEVHGHRRGIEN